MINITCSIFFSCKIINTVNSKKDLEEIPDNVKEGLKIIPLSKAQDVLQYALTKEVKPKK